MAPRTIILKGNGVRKEAPALGVITPGYLISIDTASKAIPHGVAKGAAQPAFAMENELFGKGIATDYAATDQVLYEVMPPGSEIYALVAASAAAIVIGDQLESAGDGTLRKKTAFAQSGTTPFAVTAEGHAIAVATEAVDNSGGGSEARIIVEVL